jgi:hypothetical protein
LKGIPAGEHNSDIRLEEAVSPTKVITGGNTPMAVARTSWAAKMTRPGVPAQSLSQTVGPGQGIALRTGFFALDWTLRFTRTTVTVDGHRHQLPWGEHFFPLEPGRHQLQVSYRYLRLSAAGNASLDVDVTPHRVVEVSYLAPIAVLVRGDLPGKLTVETHTQS